MRSRLLLLLLLPGAATAVDIPINYTFKGGPPTGKEWTRIHRISTTLISPKARTGASFLIDASGRSVVQVDDVSLENHQGQSLALALRHKPQKDFPFKLDVRFELDLEDIRPLVVELERVELLELRFRLISALTDRPAADRHLNLLAENADDSGYHSVSMETTDEKGEVVFTAWGGPRFRVDGRHRNIDPFEDFEVTDEVQRQAMEGVFELRTIPPELSGTVWVQDGTGARSPYLEAGILRMIIESRKPGIRRWSTIAYIENGTLYSYHLRDFADIPRGVSLKFEFSTRSGSNAKPAPTLDVLEGHEIKLIPGSPECHGLELVLADAQLVALVRKSKARRLKSLLTAGSGLALLAVFLIAFRLFNRIVTREP